MSYRDWEVGDKLVCIDASCHPGGMPSGLTEGSIYTILRIGIAFSTLLLDVKELKQADRHLPRFRAERFRKLNKPDEAKGSKADWQLLLNNHTKIPVGPINPRIPVPAHTTPMLPPPEKPARYTITRE